MSWVLVPVSACAVRRWGGAGADDGAGGSAEVWRWGPGDPPPVRVTLATITRPGWFTPMPGRRRWLLVLDPGDGLALDGRDLPAGAVWAGPGAPAARAALVGGAACVLNVISADGLEVQPQVVARPTSLGGGAGVLVAIARQVIDQAGRPLALAAGDAVVARGPAGPLGVPGPALWVPAPAP